MRKSLIAQSVAALIGGLAMAGAANAQVWAAPAGPLSVYGTPQADELRVNTDGIGHILLVPYYSTQNNNDTYINITNTDTRMGKAVKVRFRAASNSDDVFDFTVLMSPGDNFSFAITQGANGLPRLVTNDKTCTLPLDVKQSFVTARLDSALTDDEKAFQTREGYVEILNMADIPPTIAYSAADPTTLTLFNSIKHVSGVPRDCNSAAVNALGTFTTGYGDRAAAFNGDGVYDPRLAGIGAATTALRRGLDVPTTGLMANWTVINVPGSSSFSGAAVAVAAVEAATSQYGYGNVVFFPQTSTPVDIANAEVWTSDPLLRGGTTNNNALPTMTVAAPVEAAAYDFPDLSTPYLSGVLGALANGEATRSQAVVLSNALAVQAVTNEFVTDPNILAQTDWIFSMPTRRYNVAYDYEYVSPTGARGRRLFTDLEFDDGDGAIAGNTNFYTPTNTAVVSKQICVLDISLSSPASLANRYSGATTADREERFVTQPTEFVISPGTPAAPLTFCGEVSVLSFNAAGEASVLGAQIARKDVTVPYADGWVRIATPGLGGNGLPIIGAATMNLYNGASAEGTASNYGLTFPHRSVR